MTRALLASDLFATVLDHPISQQLGTVLLHFLWQGVLLAVLLELVLRTPAGITARGRYVASMAALALMAACPAVTFVVTSFTTASPAVSSTTIALPPAAGANVVGESDIGRSGSFDVPAVDSPPAIQPAQAHAAAADESWPAFSSLQIPPSWKPNLVLIWLTGVTALGARLLLGWCGQVWLGGDRRPLPAKWARHADLLADRLGVVAGRVFVSTRIVEAVAVGFVRPVVLVPAAWVAGLSPAVLEAVIAHELAHVRRWDLWANLFQRLAETVLFYHPAVWWVSHRASMDRELCCDELAVAATGRRLDYARALEAIAATRVAEQGSRHTPCAVSHGTRSVPATLAPTGGTFALAFGGRTNMKVLTRVQNVLGMSAKSRSGLAWPVCAVALALPVGLSLVTAGPATAADKSSAPTALVDGEGTRTGPRDGEAPKPGPRDGERPKEGDRPREGEVRRDGDRPKEGESARRDGDRPKEGDRPREGETARPKEGDRPREGGEAKPAMTADAERKARRVFEAHDENKNGSVSFAEWLDMRSGAAESASRSSAERERFNSFDRNRDSALSFEEFLVSRGEPAAAKAKEPARRDGEREGTARPAPRDGEGAPRTGTRDGEVVKPGPRDGEGARKPGPRDGEGAPRTGTRDGDVPKSAPREGDDPRRTEVDR